MTAQTMTAARPRSAWQAAHAPVAGVPRWARIAALAVPLTVLPSSVWRIAAVTFHLPIARGDHGSGDLPGWLPMELYAVLLSALSEVLAFTAVGLIAGWGEVFPRWIPVLRGRRVPVSLAVVPAALASVLLTVMWTLGIVGTVRGTDIYGEPIQGEDPLSLDHWEGWLAVAAYAPLLLWGPLLGAVTFAYHRRRTGR